MAVTSLVHRSVLNREESATVVRFLLLETLREYGQEKLRQRGEYVRTAPTASGLV
jgi:non-specific serine/threonine protein kinase